MPLSFMEMSYRTLNRKEKYEPEMALRTRPSGLLKFREYCRQVSPTVGV